MSHLDRLNPAQAGSTLAACPPYYTLWLLLAALLWAPLVMALNEDDLLPAERAFALTVTATDGNTLIAQWTIADGYYLYRERFKFQVATLGIQLGELHFPAGKVKEDPFFGRMETYHDTVQVELPLRRETTAAVTVNLRITDQGCAEAGFCYPPQTRTVTIPLPAVAALESSVVAEPVTDLRDALTKGQRGRLDPARTALLDAAQAFTLTVTATDPRTLVAHWDIAEGYYLYRDKLSLSLEEAGDLRIQSLESLPGREQDDEFFGRQQVYYQTAMLTAHLQGNYANAHSLRVKVAYQGCAEIGVCYPPQVQTVPVTLAALTTESGSAPGPATTALPTVTPSAPVVQPAPPPEAEQDRLARLLAEQRLWAMPAFFGFGLLLAFTPCVFPMVPILSSLIAGQGKAISERRALLLSLTYVLAMALTYTVAGILAALLGQNLQALFQHPVVIIAFSLLFVVLALAMFGLFHLQLPAHWQRRLSEYSHRHHDGGYLGVAVMGLLSALIVGPCVAPPLVGVLMMIASTGDVGLGALALFVMALGMGTPLLLIGASAGRLLPKVGPWMAQLQAVFGVLLLAVAIWLLERLLPAAISMLLWATLLIVCATYLGALQPLDHGAPAWRMLIKGLGMVLLLYGFLLLVGVAAGGRDVWQPLRGVGLLAAGRAELDELAFRPVKTVAELEAALRTANGRPVLLDFYADWCVSCKELERYTLGDPAVRMALADTVLLRADVTANDEADRALLQRFGLIGPPVILFFDRRGEEQRAYRVVGFVAAEPFQAHLARMRGAAVTAGPSPAGRRGE